MGRNLGVTSHTSIQLCLCGTYLMKREVSFRMLRIPTIPPTADDPDSNAKDAVLGMLQLNTSLNGALLFYLGSQKPFPDGVLSDPGNLPGYQDRIEQIMHSNAKNINCLEDLIELKLRLE